ncbi:ABC transporter substrate-binding protein [Rugamonas apoptosis]|uniref:ABC transporter substrate-binding protein n=1 Tax=Rugamonas apoptosis TaxID=2758570 RepID=A0A7W2FFC1_9BURK|nr:ABC transporter substrate-binding protein [Rugamonas apoptosis]MBA5690651.1 ABC transporter substrate-binding protein [Rugamonas apoptosis]
MDQFFVNPLAIEALAPRGVLRAAINFGNPILASKDFRTGEPYGVSVDLARELARRLGLALRLVGYEAAGKVTAAACADEWDVAFLAIDHERGSSMEYSAPYVLIEGAYLVPERSVIRDIRDVDQAGNRVVVGQGSAYDLFLSRMMRHAQIVRTATSPQVTETMLAEGYEVAAGVKQQLEADMRRLPGGRLLDGSFMSICQAMAVPKGRLRAIEYLVEFVEMMKASGFVAASLKRHRIGGAAIAPVRSIVKGAS